MRFLSVVIPAYNEEQRIAATLQNVSRYLMKQEEESEIIIVNDGSTDRTEQVIRRFMAGLDDYKRFKTQLIYIAEKKNRGKGFVLKKGILEARGSYVLFMDADSAAGISEITKLLPHVQAQYDIAIGSRSIAGAILLKHQPPLRERMGKIFNRLVCLTTVKGFIDTQCGFKLFRRSAARAIFTETKINGFACDVEMLYIAMEKNLKIIEVPITWEDHPDSRVHLIRGSLAMLRDLLKIRRLHKKKKTGIPC